MPAWTYFQVINSLYNWNLNSSHYLVYDNLGHLKSTDPWHNFQCTNYTKLKFSRKRTVRYDKKKEKKKGKLAQNFSEKLDE